VTIVKPDGTEPIKKSFSSSSCGLVRFFTYSFNPRLSEWVTDFPVQAEGIFYASDASAVSFADGIDLPCTGFQSAGEHLIGIRNSEDQSNHSSTDRSGNRAGAIRRFLA
jgi:hypothetical protein